MPLPRTGFAGASGGGPRRVVWEHFGNGFGDIVDIGVPAGRDVMVEMWGAGAGGSGGKTVAVTGGNGGGGGGYAAVVVPAALWALGGTWFSRPGSNGASANGSAANPSDMRLELGPDAVLLVPGGRGGKAPPTAPADEVSPVIDPRLTVLVSRPTIQGHQWVAGQNGADGANSAGPGGIGGKGATTTANAIGGVVVGWGGGAGAGVSHTSGGVGGQGKIVVSYEV